MHDHLLDDWNPRSPIPDGVHLNNLRKVGKSEVRLRESRPIARIAVTVIMAALLLASLVYAVGPRFDMTVVALLVVMIASGITFALSLPRWRISILSGELNISCGRQLLARRKRRIAFSSIESICIERPSPKSASALNITTSTSSIAIGEGLSEGALLWLKNYLIMEFAGLTWRPITGASEPLASPAGCIGSNPIMLKPDLALRLISLFLEQAPAVYQQLSTAISSKNAVGIRRHAHWLKSASANVGAHQLSELCQLIEADASDSDLAQSRILIREVGLKIPGIVNWLTDIQRNAAQALATSEPSHGPTQYNAASGVCQSGSHRDSRREAKVLVVDDSALSREVARDLLSTLITTVEFADDGGAAVEMWRKYEFDLIFMDCEMILMNGFDATRMIRSEERARGGSRIPIVALTGHVLNDYREQCLAAGMDDYLGKPCRPDSLRQMLEQWLPTPAIEPPAPVVESARSKQSELLYSS